MKPTKLPNILLALVMGVWLVLAGCSAQDAANISAGRGGNCQADADCPGDQTCRVGFCSVRASETTVVGFRFIPPSSSDFLPQHIRGVQVRAGDYLDFGLERSITVSSGPTINNESGDQPRGIRFAGSPLKGPSGTLLFQPVGVEDQISTREASVDEGAFSARITPGEYSLTFIPDDRTKFPKKTWPAEVFESNTYLLRTVPNSSDLIGVEGTLSRQIAVSGSTTTTSETLANAQVYALAVDGRASSTVATTNEYGEYQLEVAPNTGTYDVFVVPTSSNQSVLNAEFEKAFESGENECVTRDGARGDPCILTLPLGAYPADPNPITAILETPGSYAGEASLEGTRVVVSATVAAGTYTRKYEVRYDPDSGTWQVDLELFPVAWSFDEYPRYSVQIIPPAGSPFARTEAVLEGQIASGEQPGIAVDIKKKVVGQVLDSQGRPVSTAKVEFRATSGAERDSRTNLVTTDVNGTFEVWLEKTPHEVVVVPPQGNGQPRMLTHAGVSDIDQGELSLMLPEPTVLVGSVLGARDADASEFAGIADVTVEAYKIIDGRMVVLGQSRTGAGGEFRMAISSEL